MILNQNIIIQLVTCFVIMLLTVIMISPISVFATEIKSSEQKDEEMYYKTDINNVGPVRFDAEETDSIPGIIAIAMIIIFGVFTTLYHVLKDRKYKLLTTKQNQAGKIPLN